MTDKELNTLKQEYLAKGGEVTKLEPTKLNETLGDNSRLKYWGEVVGTKEQKQREKELRCQGLIVASINETRNKNGGINED
tara:strand:- start:246 stop:488 length:243 start_codon:yes stop_codon:yes gene_type:complete